MTKPSTTKVPCNFCAGTGKRSLGPENMECLKALRKLASATAREIHEAINKGRNGDAVDICTVHLRLRRMAKQGVVKKTGKVFVEV